MIHSIVSLSDIFYNEDDQPKPPVYRKVRGGLVETDGKRIRRLISTDPGMYLDKRYEPGNKM